MESQQGYKLGAGRFRNRVKSTMKRRIRVPGTNKKIPLGTIIFALVILIVLIVLLVLPKKDDEVSKIIPIKDTFDDELVKKRETGEVATELEKKWARYIRVERVGPSWDYGPEGSIVNLDGISANYPNGQRLVPVEATSGSNYENKYPASNLLDGGVAATIPDVPPYDYAWMEIDLGRDEPIQSIYIKNRRDCCQNRAIGLQAVIENSKREVVWKSAVFNTVKDLYHFPVWLY